MLNTFLPDSRLVFQFTFPVIWCSQSAPPSQLAPCVPLPPVAPLGRSRGSPLCSLALPPRFDSSPLLRASYLGAGFARFGGLRSIPPLPCLPASAGSIPPGFPLSALAVAPLRPPLVPRSGWFVTHFVGPWFDCSRFVFHLSGSGGTAPSPRFFYRSGMGVVRPFPALFCSISDTFFSDVCRMCLFFFIFA